MNRTWLLGADPTEKSPPKAAHQSVVFSLVLSRFHMKKKLCFFCDVGATKGNPLHTVATENAGRALKKAVELSDNKRLCVKLNTGINPEDAHAIDIKYHKRCWAKYVTHVHTGHQTHQFLRIAKQMNLRLRMSFSVWSRVSYWMVKLSIWVCSRRHTPASCQQIM